MNTATEGPRPGIHHMTGEEYHRDRTAISSSGVRLLLPPNGCPARFRYDMDNPPDPTNEMDLGSAAHKVVLGVGPELVILDAENYKKPATRAARADARQRGKLALLPHQYDQVQEMAAALAEHEPAAELLRPGTGEPEVVLFWHDQRVLAEAGELVRRKAMLDWLSHLREARYGRLIVVDYKTADSAERTQFMKSVYKFGYHQQAAWNLDGVRALGIDADPVFRFIVQEKKPPYIPNVIELDHHALMWGRELNMHAVDIFRKCVKSGRWPTYSDDIEVGVLPGFAEKAHADSVEFMKKWVENTGPDPREMPL